VGGNRFANRLGPDGTRKVIVSENLVVSDKPRSAFQSA